ncbi:MAG: ParA family protein [Deltaproteobacteria bacterium]|nr:ParA family protein [Deltaproteobacteria bacterium]
MVIAVVNNKGGTGKTTTCVNLSAALADTGYRVLLVDLDPQASASLSLGVERGNLSPSAADVLFKGTSIKLIIRPCAIQRLHLLTGDIELANTDLNLADVPGRERRLSESLMSVRQDYDFILCDCPPSMSMLPVNALMAADGYIIPVAPEYLALEGLVSFMTVIGKLRKGMGINPELVGIVFTMVERVLGTTRRTTRDIIGLIREHYGEDVFETEIRRDVRLNESPSFSRSIFDFAPRSHAARAYAMLAREVIDRCSMNGKKTQR